MLQREHSAIVSTFITVPFVIKIFVLSNFEWPFYTGFSVCCFQKMVKNFEKIVLSIPFYWSSMVTIFLVFIRYHETEA